MPERNPFLGATFAERKKIRESAEKTEEKAVHEDADSVEDKGVKRDRAAKKS